MPLTVHAAGGIAGHTPRPVDWNQRDTAIYVVSTLNLLHTSRGASIPQRLTRRRISHYDVYADTQLNSMYFIELRRQSGDIVGAFAYHIGWLKPRSVTPFCNKLGVPRADARIVDAYKNDARQFIGSFTSTLPS
ncbi:MAG: hypothetical protein ACR2JC_16010 [Chloroflexota bacterium]